MVEETKWYYLCDDWYDGYYPFVLKQERCTLGIFEECTRRKMKNGCKDCKYKKRWGGEKK